MYSNLPNLVLGFHGCDTITYKKVLYEHEGLSPSSNLYDWLGNGIYFWENSLARARQWAEESCDRYNKKNPQSPPKKPAVIGAVICLGHCLNLTDYRSADILRTGYEVLKYELELSGQPLPKNKTGRSSSDLLLRNLDCAVITRIHRLNQEMEKRPYDSVRGIFLEGDPVYPEAGINEKTHAQLCIINPNCIKGYFAPLTANTEYVVV